MPASEPMEKLDKEVFAVFVEPPLMVCGEPSKYNWVLLVWLAEA